MTTEEFAAEYRLKIARDECGDAIIPGRRGHLYWDDGLCAMWLNARPMNRSTLLELGGKVWQGDISPDMKGHRVQDAWVKGISPNKIQQAIRLIGAKPRRIMSEAQRMALEKATAASPLIPRQTHAGTHSQAPEAILEGLEVSEVAGVFRGGHNVT